MAQLRCSNYHHGRVVQPNIRLHFEDMDWDMFPIIGDVHAMESLSSTSIPRSDERHGHWVGSGREWTPFPASNKPDWAAMLAPLLH